MPDLNPHITSSDGNTFGTLFDLILRPEVSQDTRCNAMLQLLLESVMVVFPKDVQQAIEDSIVTSITSADGRFANVNLAKISNDLGNTAQSGTDGGIYVPRNFASGSAPAPANVSGVFNLPVNFGTLSYHVSVEPTSDPGSSFRWWVVSKTEGSVTVGFLASTATNLNIYASG